MCVGQFYQTQVNNKIGCWYVGTLNGACITTITITYHHWHNIFAIIQYPGLSLYVSLCVCICISTQIPLGPCLSWKCPQVFTSVLAPTYMSVLLCVKMCLRLCLHLYPCLWSRPSVCQGQRWRIGWAVAQETGGVRERHFSREIVWNFCLLLCCLVSS